ncbi:hypothetical protein FRC02_009906 [Tulasnella sp. 418]|nr:hypothetical protein FRC02_009906 [Tulasnella sp. 418]
MSSVMYAMIVSAAEMVSAFPYSGGTIGLASYFADPALAFAQGWLAWYHWSITIPVQIGWAIGLTRAFTHMGETAVEGDPHPNSWKLELGLIAFFVITIFVINCLRTRVYGRLEFVFSSFKVLVIIFLVVLGFGLFVSGRKECPRRASRTFVGGEERFECGYIASGLFCNWMAPMGVYGLPGPLALCAAIMSSSIAFSGLETTAIVAGEVINAAGAIKQIAWRTWLRVSILYVAGILIAGFVVPSSSVDLFWDKLTDSVLPGNLAGVPDTIRNICLRREQEELPPRFPLKGVWTPSPFVIMLQNARVPVGLIYALLVFFMLSTLSAATAETFVSSRYLYFLGRLGLAPRIFNTLWPLRRAEPEDKSLFGTPIPIVALLATVTFSSLSFMIFRPDIDSATNREWVLYWMGYMTACAAMQSWITILFTYIRFYYGVEHKRSQAQRHTSNDSREQQTLNNLEILVAHYRHKGQPWLAFYALIVSILVLVFHGFNTLRLHNISPLDPEGQSKKSQNWVIYSPFAIEGNTVTAPSSDRIAKVVVNYLPLPMFFLLLFGYKLIFQTKMRSVSDMDFTGAFERPQGIGVSPEARPSSRLGRFWWWLVS